MSEKSNKQSSKIHEGYILMKGGIRKVHNKGGHRVYTTSNGNVVRRNNIVVYPTKALAQEAWNGKTQHYKKVRDSYRKHKKKHVAQEDEKEELRIPVSKRSIKRQVNNANNAFKNLHPPIESLKSYRKRLSTELANIEKEDAISLITNY